MDRLRDRVVAMEHNLETLRTHVTQMADLRDAQGIREDHRAIIARRDSMKLKNVQLCTLFESSFPKKSVGWKPCLLVRMGVR